MIWWGLASPCCRCHGCRSLLIVPLHVPVPSCTSTPPLHKRSPICLSSILKGSPALPPVPAACSCFSTAPMCAPQCLQPGTLLCIWPALRNTCAWQLCYWNVSEEGRGGRRHLRAPMFLVRHQHIAATCPLLSHNMSRPLYLSYFSIPLHTSLTIPLQMAPIHSSPTREATRPMMWRCCRAPWISCAVSRARPCLRERWRSW